MPLSSTRRLHDGRVKTVLVLMVDEDNTGASMCAEMICRSVFMQRGLAHKVMSAGWSQKKAGKAAEASWRATAKAAGLSLDKAQSTPLSKKDLKRAGVVVAISPFARMKLEQQGVDARAWMPPDESWPATASSMEALAAHANKLADELTQEQTS